MSAQAALSLYTKAITLDPFNHEYHHHSGETLLLFPPYFMRRGNTQHQLYFGLAVLDAQASLDLCPEYDVPWLTIIQASLQTGDLDGAQRFLDMVLQVVSQSDIAWTYYRLIDYKKVAKDMKMPMGPATTTRTIHVKNPKDKYYYVYTNGHHNHGRQPELIAMDLGATARAGVQSAVQRLQRISSTNFCEAN